VSVIALAITTEQVSKHDLPGNIQHNKHTIKTMRYGEGEPVHKIKNKTRKHKERKEL
jgi:hypothetical protein